MNGNYTYYELSNLLKLFGENSVYHRIIQSFQLSTKIEYALPGRRKVSMTVYDINGKTYFNS